MARELDASVTLRMRRDVVAALKREARNVAVTEDQDVAFTELIRRAVKATYPDLMTDKEGK